MDSLRGCRVKSAEEPSGFIFEFLITLDNERKKTGLVLQFEVITGKGMKSGYLVKVLSVKGRGKTDPFPLEGMETGAEQTAVFLCFAIAFRLEGVSGMSFEYFIAGEVPCGTDADGHRIAGVPLGKY